MNKEIFKLKSAEINTHISNLLLDSTLYDKDVNLSLIHQLDSIIDDTYIIMGANDELLFTDDVLNNYFKSHPESKFFAGLIIKSSVRFGLRITSLVLTKILGTVDTPYQLLVLIYILCLKSKVKDINIKVYDALFDKNKVINKVILGNLFELGKISKDKNYFFSDYAYKEGIHN